MQVLGISVIFGAAHKHLRSKRRESKGDVTAHFKVLIKGWPKQVSIFFQTLVVKGLAQKPSYGGKISLSALSMEMKDLEEKNSGEALLDSYSAGEEKRCYCIAVALKVMDLYNL